MALGDALNSLAGGYQRGQAQFAANEDARQKAAAAGAKAAQDAAEFRLKLAQHSQTLTNSAEDEYNAIMAEITGDNWDPAKIPALMPRVANFDKTYGAVWGGGSATEMIKKALHLDGGGEMKPGEQGPPDPNAAHPLMGFLSPEQKSAADEKAMKSRSAAAAREFSVQAAEYARNPNGGLPDEATFYRKIYEFQEMINRQYPGKFDLATIDAAMDILRENAAPYFRGVADQLDQLDKSTARRDAINTRVDEVGRQASTWITSILQLDQKEGGLTGDLFAQRTPVRLKMEREAQVMAERGMELGQIKMLLASKFSNEVGGLELDIRKTPGAGALTFAGAPREAISAVNRIYDTNELGDREPFTEAVYDQNSGRVMIFDLGTGAMVKAWPEAGSPLEPDSILRPNKEATRPPAPDGATAEIDGKRYHKVGGKWEPVE